MIYTVTISPAIDYVVHLDRLQKGATNRSTGEEYFLGGKGINVSQILKELGMESIVLGFVNGFTGKALENGTQEIAGRRCVDHFREYPGRCSTGYLQQASGISERKRCSVYRRYQWSSPHGCTEVSSIPDQAKHG